MPQAKSDGKRSRRAGISPASAAPRRKSGAIPSPPPTRKGAQSRENLKAAALRALEQKGYRSLRLTDIAREADVNISLVYHYFRDKAHLVFEALKDLIDMGQILPAEEERPTDPFEALFQANRMFAEFYRDRPGLMRAIVHFDEEHPEFHALYRDGNRTWMHRIAQNIMKRCPGAALTEGEAVTVAYAIGGMADKFLFELYVERIPDLVKEFDNINKAARFLSILWYRALYLDNPPPEQTKGFEKLATLRLNAC